MFLKRLYSRPPRGASYPVASADSVRGDFSSGSVGEHFILHRGHPSTKWIQYFDVYDQYLPQLRNLCAHAGRPIKVIEIGVGDGGSLQVWKDYFGGSSQVVGIDIDPLAKKEFGPGIDVVVGSQSDTSTLDVCLEILGSEVDFVIDDGSHRGSDQIATFEYLWPHLSVGGVYIVEDLHTAYWPRFSGGVRRNGTFIEYAKDMVDDIHHWYHRQPARALRGVSSRQVMSVSFHDSVVVITKGKGSPPRRIDLGRTVPIES